MIDLQPIKIPTLEWEQIEDQIKELFKKEIYLPLLLELSQNANILKNASDALVEALQAGKITFYRGKFSGTFNSAISKRLRDLGAKWLRSEKCYSLALKEIPIEIRGVISASEDMFLRRIRKIDEKIAAVVPEELVKKLKIERFFDRSLWKVNKSYESAVKKITVPPQLSDESAERLRKEWRDNINLSIKGIADEVLPKLRKEIQENIYKGNRYGAMIDTLQKSYGLSASRAKYVARNETNLMMAKFKQERLAEVGIQHYKWVCVKGTPDHQVRPIHRELNDRSAKGEIFDFKNPPVAEASGEHYNPHERNNCFPGSTLTRFDHRILKIFRRPYAGKLVLLVTSDGVIHESTPNHPILTNRGWIAAQDIDLTDYLLQGRFEDLPTAKVNTENLIACMEDIFNAISSISKITMCPITHADFHGDVPEHNKVDIIDVNRHLLLSGIAKTYEVFKKFIFESPNFEIPIGSSMEQALLTWRLTPQRLISFLNELSLLIERHSRHPQDISLGGVTLSDIHFLQPTAESTSGNTILGRDGQFTHPFLIILDRLLIQWSDVPSNTSPYFNDFNATSSELLAEKIGQQPDFTSDFGKGEIGRFIKPLRLIDKSFRDFNSHVYNFETSTHWYYANHIIVSNCRCTASPVFNFKRSFSEEK